MCFSFVALYPKSSRKVGLQKQFPKTPGEKMWEALSSSTTSPDGCYANSPSFPSRPWCSRVSIGWNEDTFRTEHVNNQTKRVMQCCYEINKAKCSSIHQKRDGRMFQGNLPLLCYCPIIVIFARRFQPLSHHLSINVREEMISAPPHADIYCSYKSEPSLVTAAVAPVQLWSRAAPHGAVMKKDQGVTGRV